MLGVAIKFRVGFLRGLLTNHGTQHHFSLARSNPVHPPLAAGKILGPQKAKKVRLFS